MNTQNRNSVIKKRKQKRREQGRRGFTLVEIIVVLALIAILAAFSAGAMLGYTRFAVFKRNNENARTVFSAAQSAITYYKASGRLEKLRRDVEALPQSPAYVPAAAFEADQELMESEAEDRRNGTISYLILSKEYYDTIKEQIRANSAAEVETGDGQTDLLFELLRDYITDVSIYNATICVEFDATDGVVSGVLYCDSAKNFSYGPSAGAVDITDREESHREDIGLGYYSTALSARAPQEVGDLEIVAANLKNAETLDVEWFLEKQYQYLKGTLDYNIDIYEQEGVGAPVRRASIGLSKEQVQGISVESGENAQVKPMSVTLYAEDGTPFEIVKDGVLHADLGGGEMTFHAYLASEEKYGDGFALSLDALDTYLAEAMEVEEPLERQAEIMKTFSARRLSLDMDGTHYGLDLSGTKKIQAEVSIAQKPGGQGTNLENLLFADGSAENKAEEGAADLYAYEYEIANARHLYNVRFREQEVQAAAASVDSAVYKIVNDFAWGGPDGILSFTDQSPAGGTAAGIEKPEGNLTKVFEQGEILALAQDSSYPAFPSIRSLGEKSTLLSANAESSGEPEEGAPGTGDSGDEDVVFTIGFFAFEPDTETAEGASRLADNVGLVQENRGTIKNLKLSDVDVRGIRRAPEEEEGAAAGLVSVKNVGAFCGVNSGVLENVQTMSGSVTGGENVGGIAGAFGDAEGVSEIAKLKNGAQVSGLKYVGGIVGNVTDRVISDCENTGIVYGYALPETEETLDGKTPAEVTPLFIGGIVGSAAGSSRIVGCVSSPAPQQGDADALQAGELEAMLTGNYVGGIAGCLSGSAGIESCAVGIDTETAEDTTGTGAEEGAGESQSAACYVLGDSFVGGIVGCNSGDGSIAADAENGRDVCAAMVLGRRFVGGIAGVNGRPAADLEAADPRAITHRDFAETSASAITGWRCTGFAAALQPEEENAGDAEADGAGEMAYPSYVGGIAGANLGKIENCVTEQSGEKPGWLEALTGAGADYTGGVAGYNGGMLLADEDPESLQIAQVKGRNFVGGVAGYNDAILGQGIIENYALSGLSAEGENFVGGLAGLNTADTLWTDESGAPKPLAWSAENVRGRSYVGGLAGANITEKSLTIAAANPEIGTVTADCAFAGGLFGYSRIVPEGGAGTLFREDGGGLLDQLLEASGQNPDPAAGEDQPLMTQEQLDEFARQVLALDAAGGSAAGETLTITGVQSAQENAGGGAAEGGEENTGRIEGQLFVGGVLGYHAADSSLLISRYTADTSVSATGAAAADMFDRYGADLKGNPRRYSFSGGILGYVTKNTTLDNCRVSGTVETAGTCAGGLAEVNEGKILSCAAAAMEAERNYAGGVVGLNGFTYEADGTVTPGVLQSCAVPEGTEVHGVSVVGGLAAENLGEIRAESAGTGSEVEGGGTVSAAASYAGGLAGINRGTIENIQGVSVRVSAPEAQYVGGVAGLNEGGILGVSVGSGTAVTGGSCAGGLAGLNRAAAGRENSGLISDHTQTAGGTAQTFACVSQAAVTAAATAGGIAGENAGSIVRAEPRGSVQAGSLALGGIAGVNDGVIGLGDYPLAQELELSSSGAAYIGGIAGVNRAGAVIEKAGAEEGAQRDTYAQIGAALNDKDAAWATAAMGGAAGSNAGTIRRVLFVGALDGYGSWTKEEPDGAEPPAYGGIAGINDGLISECGLGLDTDNAGDLESAPKEASVRADGRNYLGGIAGWNRESGLIAGVTQEDAKPNRARVLISSRGALATGGIAGVNEGAAGASGSAEDADVETGANWRIEANAAVLTDVDEEGNEYEYTFAGPVGGIVGIQRGALLSGLVNHAGSVQAENAGTDGADEKAGVYGEGETAGGIAGSVEDKTDADGLPAESPEKIVIQNCRNLGPVTSACRAGGILGEWASGADGEIVGCANGRTSGLDPNPAEDAGDPCAVIRIERDAKQAAEMDTAAAAGIVGGFHGLVMEQTVSVQDCANFGVLEGAPGAGIAVLADSVYGKDTGREESGTAGTEEADITVDDCVNAGRMAQGAGLVLVYPDAVMNVGLSLTRSRNYGRPAGEDESGFAGLLACASTNGEDTVLFRDYASLSEILESGQIRLWVRNCIGVADVIYPTVPMEAEKEEQANTFASLETLFASANNYYYSEKDGQPCPLETAGIGSAVSYETGAYQSLPETSVHGVREDLRAKNALAEDGGVFDPNGLESVTDAVYRSDCRGNYNRLDAALREACEKDSSEEPEEQKKLIPPEFSICLMGAENGAPVYGLRLDNFDSYQEFDIEKLELALKLEARPFGTDGARVYDLRIALSEFADGNLCALRAENLDPDSTAAFIGDEDLTLGIEAWVQDGAVADRADETEGEADSADGTDGEAENTDGQEAAWRSDSLVEPNLLLPGADSLTLMPEEVVITAETAEEEEDAGALRIYTFTGAGADNVVYRVEVLEGLLLDESDVLLDTATASALLQGSQTCVLTGGAASVARVYPTEIINGSVHVVLGARIAAGLDLAALKGGAEGEAPYIESAEDYRFRPADGCGIEAVREAGEDVYSGFHVYSSQFLKADSPFAACVFDPGMEPLTPDAAAIGIDGDLFFEESETMQTEMFLETEEIARTDIKTEHTMTVTDKDGIVSGIETVELSHPALTWRQEPSDTANAEEESAADGEETGINADIRGWRIELFNFLDAEVSADAEEYDAPSLTVDLLRNEDGNGYRIERALTQEEEKQWREEHPGEEMPEYLHISLPAEEDTLLYELEHRKNEKLKRAYTVTLDKQMLGTDDAACRYEQTVDGVGGRVIENVCPQLRILEYEKDPERGILKDYVQYALILPDVEQDSAFLMDYTMILRTHSVTVEPLDESKFGPQSEGLQARRVQYTYLLRLDSGGDGIRCYLRSLDEEQTVSEKFDALTEKEKNGFTDAEQYVLLPRNYGKEYVRQTGDAQRMQAEAAQEESGESETGQDGLFFEEEETQPDTTPQTEESTDGTETPEDPEVGISTELLTEPQTQEPAEGQTQAPTEVQTQAPTEAQTQAPTEAQTQAPTEAQTQAPTEAQTQAPTEAQTQVPTEAQTQAAAQTEAPAETQAIGEDIILEDAVGLGALDRGWGI